jgi:hypothetical protein
MGQAWFRIERRDASGAVVDWVEVGRCATCGRGVDREFPREYRAAGGVITCRDCLRREARAAAGSPGGEPAGPPPVTRPGRP